MGKDKEDLISKKAERDFQAKKDIESLLDSQKLVGNSDVVLSCISEDTELDNITKLTLVKEVISLYGNLQTTETITKLGTLKQEENIKINYKELQNYVGKIFIQEYMK